MAQTKPSRNAWWPVLGIVLLGVPLILSIAWGIYFSDAAFRTYQVAQSLVGDLSLSFAAGTLAQAPLYVGFLALAGNYAPQFALVAGALGWSATAIVILLSLRAASRPLAAIVAALLVVFSPLVLTTAGTEISWALALGWAALALTVLPWGTVRQVQRPLSLANRVFWLKLILLILLMGLHFNAATILFALTLLAIDVYNVRAGWLPFILFAVAALLWGLFMIPRYGGSPAADPLLWLRDGYAYSANRPLYWLYIPFVIAGLWDVWTWETTAGEAKSRRGLTQGQLLFVFLILWAVMAVVARSTAAPIIAAVVVFALTGLGAAWFTRKVLASGRFVMDQHRAALLVPALIAAPLLLISLVTLWDLYTARPVFQAELQDQAAAWLSENAEAEAILYAPPRVGYLAGRTTIPALVSQIRDDTVDEVYGQLLGHVPDYVVSEKGFAWDYITRTTWFQERYRAREQFANGYAPDSPLTVWEYTPSPFDDGEQETLRAVVNDSFALVGYQFEPQTITPGEDVYLTLYLQNLKPRDIGFTTVVHLSAADDGWVWAWREEWTPRSFPGEWWAPGQVIPERIRIETTEDIPLGAYDLQVFWRAGDEREISWPVVRDGDETVLDRVFLGYVNAPPPADMSQATAVDGRFSDTIVLDSFAVSDPVPGEALQVDLFWDAVAAPLDDYTVFVHVLDADGQVVAAHDGMPAENRFPTTAWKPGQIVSDGHHLALPEDLAPGTYQLNVGMYLLQTGERLPVWDAGGIEQADRVLPLTTLEIGDQ